LKKILFISLLIIQIPVIAQSKISEDNYNVQVREEQGDLNQDGLADKVIIIMDTAIITRALKLEIYFNEKNSKFKLIASSTKLLASQYHKDGTYAGNVIPDVMIEDGTLNILTERDGNHSDHCFKFQNGNFELIRYFNVIWDGKNTTTETIFDFISGIYIVQSQELGSEKITVKQKKKIKVKPLPKIQDFVPFENQIY